MKTNSKNHPVFSYMENLILDIDRIRDEYGDEVENTLPARLKWTIKTFKTEKGWEIDRYGKHAAFISWLQGIASAFPIDYTYFDIIRLAKDWGSIPMNATEAQENKICENWYNFIAVKFGQLCKFNKVQF